MRLRLKLYDNTVLVSSTSIRFQDDCTLHQLRSQVQQELLNSYILKDFTLSLNRKDELFGSPEASLKSLGLRSGDLLWVMAETTHPGALPSEACLAEGSSSSIAAPEDSAASAMEQEQMPRMLFNTSCPLEALCQLAHTALLDSGLELLQDAGIEGPPATSAGNEYRYAIRAPPTDGPPASRAACSVKYVSFGNSLVVWGSTAGGRSCHISLAAADHVCLQPGSGEQSTPESAREPRLTASNVSGLYMRLKDGFIHPILIALCAEEGRQPPPSLQLLPNEVKLLCLRHLQARDLASLACVSRDLRHVAGSDVLWEPLLVAEFGAPSPADGLLPGSGAFMHAFGARWAERKRRSRQRRRVALQPRLPFPGTGPHLVVPHPYFPAGAVGGDFDRLPHPFLGFSGTRSGGGGAFFGGAGLGLAAPPQPRWKNLS